MDDSYNRLYQHHNLHMLDNLKFLHQTYTLAEFCEEMGMEADDISMTLKVEGDGTFEYVTKSGPVSQTITGEWTFEDDELKADVEQEGAADTIFVYEDGELKADFNMGSDGSMVMIFEKE